MTYGAAPMGKLPYAIVKYHKLGLDLRLKDPAANFEKRHLLRHLFCRTKRQSWPREIAQVHSSVVAQRPIAQVIKHQPFLDISLCIHKNVLIHRTETEDWVLRLVQAIRVSRGDCQSPLRILDICSGSGCIALALACSLPNVCVVAVEKSQKCCRNIETNIRRNFAGLNAMNSQVQFLQMDYLASHLSTLDKFDLIVSNPPYIPTWRRRMVDANVLKYEMHSALFPPGDRGSGLLFHRKILSDAALLLDKPDGARYTGPKIVLEFDGLHQVKMLTRLVRQCRFPSYRFAADYLRRPRSLWVY